ncbi:YqaA family protein [Gallaecimonas sp. GXIMD4217]|uniref:YqaA family protein n=1 Tax=Gallaecimonas sp. GXIMD4217 TaxID=3131927 RepID=UPI00311B1018
MRIFSALYDRVMLWARHPRASVFLGTMSFAESVIWPVPVDVMLAPMALAKPQQAWRYALIATLTSVLGGLFGYALGWLLFEPVVMPLIQWAGYEDKLARTQAWFADYGIWVILLAGFSPLPYKVFTVTAGLMQMMLLPFMLMSLVGRAARFYLVAGLMKAGGARMEARLRHIIDWLGWATIVLALVLYLLLR